MRLENGKTYRFEYEDLCEPNNPPNVTGVMSQTTVFSTATPTYQATVTQITETVFVDEENRHYVLYAPKAEPEGYPPYMVVERDDKVKQLERAEDVS